MLVEDAIVTILIARYKNYFHLIFGTIAHTEVFQHIQHLVVRHIVQPVGDERTLQRFGELIFALQALLQVLAGSPTQLGTLTNANTFFFKSLSRFSRFNDSRNTSIPLFLNS